jgi:branched-chain amino acid transport system ATP-binding protein
VSGEIALECVGLSKRYGGVRAVDDVSLRVHKGEILGLVGPNGAGKTTVVDLITGIQKADKGETTINGRVLRGPPSWRAHVGRLARTFQHPQLAPDLTVRENLLMSVTAASLYGPWRQLRAFGTGLVRPTQPAAEAEVQRVATEVGIEDLDRLCSDLTLGMMRVVEFARALVQQPAVLLLDEPFAGSDAGTVEHVTAALSRVRDSGCGVILVDHNVDLVAALVDRIVLMNQGAVVFDGAPAECLASPEMREVYFGTRRARA